MGIDLHITHEVNAHIDRKLDAILLELSAISAQLRASKARENTSMATILDVQAEVGKLKDNVAKESTVNASIKALLEGLTGLIASLRTQLAEAIANGSDPAVLQGIVDQMTAVETANEQHQADLIAAGMANTPNDPNFPPSPAPNPNPTTP